MNKVKLILDDAYNLINSISLLNIGRLTDKAFTRKRKLGFINIIGILLNSIKRTLQTEINRYYEYVLKDEDITVTKQAFSKARQNLNPEVFRVLSDSAVKIFYSNDEFDLINNYRVLAVDGTSIELPNLEQLREEFGDVGNSSKTVRAYASAMFDVVNQVIITSEIDKYRIDERTFAKRHLINLKKLGYKNDLVLYDRGYPSREFMANHFDENIQFLMRCKNAFLDKKRTFHSNTDEIITYSFEGKSYSVRRVQFKLSSGEVETLVTSLMDLSIEELKKLYHLRWGIETEYHVLKHVLQIENFSGYTPLSIKQDFYATIYLNNIGAAFLYDSKHEQENENSPKKRKTKYEYKINRNELYASLKDKLIKMLLIDNPKSRVKTLKRISKQMQRNLVPIRPNRNPERRSSRICGIKYPVNQRKSL